MGLFINPHTGYLLSGLIVIALLGRGYLIRLARKQPAQELTGLPSPRQFALLCLLIYFTGNLGAKLFGWFWYIREILRRPDLLKALLNSREISFGALAAVICTVVWFCRKYRLDILKVLDIFFAYYAALDVLFRIGCTMFGCCIGRTVYSTPGIYFLAGQFLPLNPLARYPFTICMAAFNIWLFVTLGRAIERKHRAGEIFLKYFLLYSAGRFFLEFLRQEPLVVDFIPFTAPQIICMAVFSAAWTAWRRQNKNHDHAF